MALFNTVSTRLRDRGDLGDQIADLSRGTADLARQVAEISRRLNAVESKIDSRRNRARGGVDPLAAEIGELGGLVKQIAETVAAHAAALQKQGALPARAAPSPPQPDAATAGRRHAALQRERRRAGVERFRGLRARASPT